MSGPVEAAVRSFLPRLPVGTAITVACSGGADSLALAWAVRQVVSGPICGLTVDHGLQPGSSGQAERTAGQLRELGFDTVQTRRVQVGRVGGPEAAARVARYAALTPDSDGEAVLLGHTLDDQGETVLLGLARGSGPRSIAGMSAWKAPWGRPLLGVRRADTRNCCREAGLTWWDDPQNTDPQFTRVRLRREVLPLLEDVLGGGVAPALARTAALMADDLAALDELAGELLTRCLTSTGLDVSVLGSAPAALRRRVIRSFLRDQGLAELTANHLIRADLLLFGPAGAAVRLPGSLDVVVSGGIFKLRPPLSQNRPGINPDPPAGRPGAPPASIL